VSSDASICGRRLRIAIELRTGAWARGAGVLPTRDDDKSDLRTATPVLIKAMTDDLSLGGVALISEASLPVGSKVTFDLRDRVHDIVGHGIIVRCQSLFGAETGARQRYRIAVQFVCLGSTARRRLRSLLESSLP